MRAILKINLEIDGEYRESDKDRIIDLILSNPGYAVWVIDADRLAIIAKSTSCEIVEE